MVLYIEVKIIELFYGVYTQKPERANESRDICISINMNVKVCRL